MLPDRLQRAGQSLLGLSLGDALGSQFFVPANRPHLSSRSLPSAPWQWTDDTEMACSVYLALATHRAIDQEDPAASRLYGCTLPNRSPSGSTRLSDSPGPPRPRVPAS